jgi:hypothetical protein
MTQLGYSLTTNVAEFQGTPYTALQRYGEGYVTPPTLGGSHPFLSINLFR